MTLQIGETVGIRLVKQLINAKYDVGDDPKCLIIIISVIYAGGCKDLKTGMNSTDLRREINVMMLLPQLERNGFTVISILYEEMPYLQHLVQCHEIVCNQTMEKL